MTCEAQGLIGPDMFAIDGVKLTSNARKERDGTHAELRHRADRLAKAADKIMALHQAQDKAGMDATLEPKRKARKARIAALPMLGAHQRLQATCKTASVLIYVS